MRDFMMVNGREIKTESILSKMRKTYVIARTKVEGIHRWDGCDIDEVNYLTLNHRHMFFINAQVEVEHHDRDVEFIRLAHQIKSYLTDKYWDNQYQCAMFNSMSCEMLANELISKFDLYSCEVNEDGEGGAIVYA